MLETWRNQFSLQQLSLEHHNPIVFVTSQWQTRSSGPSVPYLVYRWIVALFFAITLSLSIVDLKHPDAVPSEQAKWLIYLTHWGYTACTLQSLMAVVLVSACVLAPRLRGTLPNLQENALKMYKVYWVSNTIATDLAIGITALYWSLIYDEKTMDLDAMNFILHAINSVLMMIDLFVVSHPIRLLHCCYPVVFGLCYAVFSVIYYAAGGISREGHTYIYNILDWDKPGKTTVVCLAVMGFVIILHILMWTLHRLRVWIHSKLLVDNENNNKTAMSEDILAECSKKSYVNEGLNASDLV